MEVVARYLLGTIDAMTIAFGSPEISLFVLVLLAVC